MEIKLLIFIGLFLQIPVCKSQPEQTSKNVEITKEVSNYFIGDNYIVSLNYSLYNKDTDNIWLWLERKDVSNETDKKIIRDYFFIIKPGGDASLLSIGMDGNVIFTPAIYKAFIKRISPNNCFTIQVISNKKLSENTIQDIFNYLDGHVVFYSEKELQIYIPGINTMFPYVFFKRDFITLPLEILKKNW